MDNNKLKKIYILIGPKGSGKTYIGYLMDSAFQIQFLRVEDIALKIKKARSFDDPVYLQDVFKAIELQVRESLHSNERLVFESTGLTHQFDIMLENLKKDFNVYLIKILADPETCLIRIKQRDTSIHVNVSDDHINLINDKVAQKKFLFNAEIDNNKASKEELYKQLQRILDGLR